MGCTWSFLRPARAVCPTCIDEEQDLETTLSILGTLMIVATLLPMAKLDDWWIRIFDFPRLQIAVISALVLVLTLIVRDDPGALHNVWLAALAASTLYQAYRMYPYTRLHAKQVQEASVPTRVRPSACCAPTC